MQSYEIAINDPLNDLLEIMYWKIFGMGQFEDCEQNHVNKNEILALIEDIRDALKGE